MAQLIEVGLLEAQMKESTGTRISVSCTVQSEKVRHTFTRTRSRGKITIGSYQRKGTGEDEVKKKSSGKSEQMC